MSILGIILSILLGIIPEIMYFYFILICTKNIKEKRKILLLGICILYFIFIFLAPYNMIFYISYLILLYVFLKLLYGNNVQIIDFFIIIYSSFYLTILSFLVCFAHNFSSYLICYAINRILLFGIFIFKKYFNKLYTNYCKYWNRNDNIKRPIKSITLRNISLIILNCVVFIMNIICIYIINFTMK